MIQLANDPNASRINYRPSQESEGKARAFEAQRGRTGHAWPFLSREAVARPSHSESQKPTPSDSGS